MSIYQWFFFIIKFQTISLIYSLALNGVVFNFTNVIDKSKATILRGRKKHFTIPKNLLHFFMLDSPRKSCLYWWLVSWKQFEVSLYRVSNHYWKSARSADLRHGRRNITTWQKIVTKQLVTRSSSFISFPEKMVRASIFARHHSTRSPDENKPLYIFHN